MLSHRGQRRVSLSAKLIILGAVVGGVLFVSCYLVGGYGFLRNWDTYSDENISADPNIHMGLSRSNIVTRLHTENRLDNNFNFFLLLSCTFTGAFCVCARFCISRNPREFPIVEDIPMVRLLRVNSDPTDPQHSTVISVVEGEVIEGAITQTDLHEEDVSPDGDNKIKPPL